MVIKVQLAFPIVRIYFAPINTAVTYLIVVKLILG